MNNAVGRSPPEQTVENNSLLFLLTKSFKDATLKFL